MVCFCNFKLKLMLSGMSIFKFKGEPAHRRFLHFSITTQSETTMSCTGVACTNPNQCNCAGIRGCSCDQYCLCRNQCRTQTLITSEVRYLIFKLSHTRSCLLTTSQDGENDTGNLNENKQGLQESTDSSQGT